MKLEIRAQRAMKKLEAIGAPVINRNAGYNAAFYIGAELRTANDRYYADYYQEEVREHWHPADLNKPMKERRIENAFGIRTEVHEILKHYGLMAEWINPGLVGVYDY